MMRLVLDGLAAHALVVGVWLVSAGVFVGIGTLLRRWWSLGARSWRDVSLSFWLGIAGAIAVLQVWHLAAPVGGGAVAMLVALGAFGLWRGRNDVRTGFRGFGGPPAIASLLLVLWIANRSLGPTTLFDTGMYHQPVVAWTNAYGIIPGLGNLHGRLAFNSASLLLAAPFDVGPLDGAAPHLLNGLLYAALATEAVASWVAARGTALPRPHDLFTIALLPNVLHGALRQDVRSLSTDASVFAVLAVSLRLLLDILAHTPASPAERARRAAALAMLLAAAVTIKLSAGVVAAAALGVALWTLRPPGQGAAAAVASGALRRLLPSGVLVAAWLARGVILSGYPLYPTAAFPFPVEWRVPAEQVAAEAAWVTMSARNLNANVIYPGMAWVQPWIRGVVLRGDLFVQLTVPVLLSAGVALWAWARRGRGHAIPLAPSWTRVWIPVGVGGAFWLASAPHPRLVQALAWGASAVALGWWAIAASPVEQGRAARRLLTVVLGVTAILAVKQAAGAAGRAGPGARAGAALDALVTRPLGGRWIAPLHEPTRVAVFVGGGLALTVPVEDNGCWNAPVSTICTPHPSSTLRLRRPARPPDDALRAGFLSLGGQWDPRRWPNPWTPFLAWWRCVARTGPSADAGRRCLTTVPGAGPPPDAAPASD